MSHLATLETLATEISANTAADFDSPDTPRRETPARPPAWMRLPALAAAQGDVERQLRSLAGVSVEELRALTKSRLRTEIEFISNPFFAMAGAGERCFETPLDGLGRSEASRGALRSSGVEMPVHLSRLCETPLLTFEQEQALFCRMNFLLQQAALHRGLLNVNRPSRARLELIDRLIGLAHWHRDRIVEANVRLVISIIKKFVNPNNTFDDMLSDGIVALMRAVEKFDYERGFRFSTYATQVIRRHSYHTLVVNQKDRQTVFCGLQDLDFDVSDDDRSGAISEKRWHALRSRLATMLDDLDRREKFIIRARFSLGSHRKVHTLQSLADRLGVSKERVRQLESRAMEKLRNMAGAFPLTELEV